MGMFDNLNNVKRATSKEEKEWNKVLSTDIRKVDKNGNKAVFYTYVGNFAWEFISQTIDSSDKMAVTIRVNGIVKVVKCKLQNRIEAIEKAVVKANK
jgi:hypothetical protein